MRFYKNRLLDEETLLKIGFKHIVYDFYDYRTQYNHIRYNLKTGEIFVNEVQQYHNVYTIWEFMMTLMYNGISDLRYEESIFKNLDYNND